jgi:uncharacterized cysteine cluster protein YcgN (CxxCxxCC family)
MTFWKTTSLDDMTTAQWESLCDGCARCCLIKLEDEDTGEIYSTHVGCTLLDRANCRCSDYANRAEKVADCVVLTPQKVRDLNWLPPTCAYRLVANKQDLPWWHPLVSGDPSTVEKAGISVKGRVPVLEHEVNLLDMPDQIVSWPGKWPKAAKKPA